MILAVVFALAAAFSSAVNLMTQHAASISAPKREKGWRLAVYLVRQPLWLLGGAAAVGTFVFQALALHFGPLSVVQPILITELVFTLVLRRVWIHQDVAGPAWAGVLVVCAALGVFLWAAEPTGGHPGAQTARWLSAVLVFGGTAAVLVLLGRQGSPRRRAAVFAAAAAIAWSMEATFLKAATQTLATFGFGGMLIRWPIYAMIGATVGGTLLQQAALHVGPLSVSQPVMVITDPLASIVLSVWVFAERFTSSPAQIAIAAVSFAVMAAGVIVVTRTAPENLTPSARYNHQQEPSGEGGEHGQRGPAASG